MPLLGSRITKVHMLICYCRWRFFCIRFDSLKMIKADLLDQWEPLLEPRSRSGTKWFDPNNLAITRDELCRKWYKPSTVFQRRAILTRPFKTFYLGHTKPNSPLNCSLGLCYLTKFEVISFGKFVVQPTTPLKKWFISVSYEILATSSLPTHTP